MLYRVAWPLEDGEPKKDWRPGADIGKGEDGRAEDCAAEGTGANQAIRPDGGAAGECRGGSWQDAYGTTAANYWGRAKKAHGLDSARHILGERWARDHADDKKPALAAALETAFDPRKNSVCINLDRLARDTAAAWLPPGMDYGDPADNASADRGLDDEAAANLDGNRKAADPAATDGDETDLPAFLTENELTVAINGAAAD